MSSWGFYFICGWDGMGLDGISKVYFKFLHVFKVCHQHSNGFENSISSWGIGILFLKLPQVVVFFNFHAKSKVLPNNWRPEAFLKLLIIILFLL